MLDNINIVPDDVPETNEEFTLSLGEHEEDDDLSILLSDIVVTLTIVDDDGTLEISSNYTYMFSASFYCLGIHYTCCISSNLVAQIGFTQSVYSVIEGEAVEVCITLTDGVSLHSSLGYANFSLEVSSPSGSGLLACNAY